ncbi:hypothetical protein, partial [Cronobacter sakazakii]|uniref:hypothetical protein n=1 Tax=Cronobacter sakazakii TaxID=28141 RepID=UPI001F4602AB
AAVKGLLNVNCTNTVLVFYTQALYWCNLSIVVQPFCTMTRIIAPFWGNLKVGTDFALKN